MKNRRIDIVFIITFLAPALGLYLLFVLYPVLSALMTSMYQWRGIGAKKWIGLDNYTKMMTDENFTNALFNTFKYILLQMPLILVISTFLALLLAGSIKSRWVEFYRSSIFFPYILPSVAIAMLWATIFNPVNGLLNGLLDILQLDFLQTEWLGRKDSAFGSIVFVNIWSAIGFYTILLLAGILNIPKDIMEAAEIDGANGFKKSLYVTLPMLKDVMQVVVVFVMINSLKIFEMPQLLTGGGPNRSTQPLALYIYEQAFSNFNFGYASAIGVVFLLIIMVLTLLTFKLTSRRGI